MYEKNNDAKHLTDVEEQTDGNGAHILSYFRGHETSRKHKSKQSSNETYYGTFLAHAREKYRP